MSTRSLLRGIRDALAARAGTLALAAMLVSLGVFPGPALLHVDPSWSSHPVNRQFADEKAFWVAGALFIVGPAIVLANVLARWFDREWLGLRERMAAMSDRSFVAGAAAFAAVAALAAAVYVFALNPTTSDEVAQLWHAKILLSGRLSLPPDANPEFFAIDNVIDAGRWYSQFPAGGPAVLAIATAARATWLLNPILAGLTVVNVFRFASRAYGRGEARVSALLCAGCPFLLAMGGSYMNHTVVVFFVTLALAELPVLEAETDRRLVRASLVIGLALGSAITVRPLDGALAAVVMGAIVVRSAALRGNVRMLVLAAVAGALPVAGLLAANWLTTGHPLLFGYEVLWGANHGLGFHADPLGGVHTPARGLFFTIVYLTQLNWVLFEWPVAGILIVAAALVMIGRLGRWEILLIVWIEAQLFAYAAYWHAGFFAGPRYLVTVAPAILIIVARGIALAERTARPVVRRTVVAGVAASVLGAWLMPGASVGMIGGARAARPMRAAFKMDLDPVVESLDGRPALVFVSEFASSRLARRLWGLGISRSDASRLMHDKDHCALLDAVLAERRRAATPAERLSRLEQVQRYTPSTLLTLESYDAAVRVSSDSAITPACRTDLMLDVTRSSSMAYGVTLLENEIGTDGRIAGPIVFVADIAEHNESLRQRFGDRPWYRLAMVGASRVPRLVPYE